MIAIFPLLVFILIIFTISYVIYYLIYSKKINDRLKNNESMAHNSMISVDAIGNFLAVFGAVTIVFILFGELNGLKSDIEAQRASLSRQIADLEYDLSMLEEKITQQNSLVQNLECNVGTFHPENNTVDVVISCTPKTYSKDTRLTLLNGNKKIEFTNNGIGLFTAKESFSAFESFNYISTICQEDNGLTSSFPVEGIFPDALAHDALPSLGFSRNSAVGFKSGVINFSGDISFDGDSRNFEQLELYILKNGERLTNLDISIDGTLYNTDVTADKSDSLALVLRGVDPYQFEHRIVLSACGPDDWEMSFGEGDSIYNSEGTLILGVDIPY